MFGHGLGERGSECLMLSEERGHDSDRTYRTYRNPAPALGSAIELGSAKVRF